MRVCTIAFCSGFVVTKLQIKQRTSLFFKESSVADKLLLTTGSGVQLVYLGAANSLLANHYISPILLRYLRNCGVFYFNALPQPPTLSRV